MKKILSIDFDIIMYPCIKLYERQTSGDANPVSLWSHLNHEFNIDSFVRYDAQVLKNIAKLIQNNVKNGAKLYNIDEHHGIVHELKGQENYNDETYELTNIDFHHDLWYSDNDKIDAADFDTYRCNNWIGYLYLQKKLDNLVWVKAPNSEMPVIESEEVIINEIKTLGAISELATDFDEIYFCFSPQWVPHQYRHIFDLITSLIKED